MTEHTVAWVRLGWQQPFVWRRLALSLGLVLIPAASCFALGAGLLGLAVFALGAYPWPVRLSVTEAGMMLRWLVVKQLWSAEQLARVRISEDSRRWAWPRRRVLLIELRQGQKAWVFGRETALRDIARAANRLIFTAAN